MSNSNQSHHGSGDNVGGNKILNLSVPKLLVIAIIIIFGLFIFIYWQSIKERYFFNEDKIDVAVSIIDSLQIVGLSEDEALIYSTNELIYYDLNTSEDTLEIIPNASYINKFKNNEELPGDSEAGYTRLFSKIPKINFKVTNNSNKTIFFSKIEVDVINSEVDPDPLPTFNYDQCFIEEDNKTLSFEIYTEGWSPMKNVRLNLNIINSTEKVDYNITPYPINFPVIQKSQLVDIFPILRKQNVDVDRLIAATSMNNENEDSELNEVYMDTALVTTALGKYSVDSTFIPDSRDEIKAIVYGWITYDNIKGVSYKYKIKLPIAIYREWGCGAPSVDTGTYDIALCETGKNYKVVYPISQYIKATDVDNFSIRLICPKSSIHTMNVKLFYADDKYIEKHIKYHLIIPRRMVEDEVIHFKGNGKCSNTNQ